MGISLESKRTLSEQNNSRPVQERIFMPPITNRPTNQHQDRPTTARNHIDPLYRSSGNIRCEFPKESARPLGMLYRRSVKNDEAVVEDGELVKHMTRLPGYLKGIEKAENLQDKVLNVGVLDWSRLEQWKHKQKIDLENGSFSASTSSKNSFPRRSSRSSSSVYSSYNGSTSSVSDQRPSLRPCVIPPSRIVVPEKKGVSRSLNSFSRIHSGEIADEDETNSTKQSGAADSKRNSVDQKIFSGAEAMSSKYSVASTRTQSRVQDSQKSNTDVADPSFPGHGNKIVLLLPKESPEKGLSEVSRHRLSIDKRMTASRKCSFSEDISSSEISHSRGSSASVDTDNLSHARDRTDLPSTSYHSSPRSERKRDIPFETERVAKVSGTQELIDIPSRDRAELSRSNSRNPSPVRRFSFSLGRMGRSLSFKEDNGVPQLNSTHMTVKSGPLGADDLSNSIEKAKGHNRARSSPLRRLLDPILKHKEASQPPTRQPEYRLPPKASFDSSFSSGPVYSFPNEKTQESRVQALLQVKVNNGIPLFKFVVNSSGNILAATMKNLASSDKDNSGRSYTFYLVNEIKKKSGGWISHGSKVKNCGYAYNVVGQMKVSTSEFSRESVLFGVERKQVDQGSPKFVTNRELAASVVKIPMKDESRDEWCLSPRSRCSEECVSVILPGGVHGIPNKGEPSPLISRWRNGGSCDCGGWDLGCKLQVLSDQSKSVTKTSKSFKDGRILDSYELFVQGVEKNVPIFSLIPSKDGTFSVEYDTSVSRLQAFFISVAVLSGQKEPSDVSEPKSFETSPDHGVKFPAKYATYPPLSPAGRV